MLLDSSTSLIICNFAFNSPAWTKLNPIVCYFTEQHRQEDRDFLNLLLAIRQNVFNSGHLSHIEKRKINSFDYTQNKSFINILKLFQNLKKSKTILLKPVMENQNQLFRKNLIPIPKLYYYGMKGKMSDKFPNYENSPKVQFFHTSKNQF